jgi:hypothetical protein
MAGYVFTNGGNRTFVFNSCKENSWKEATFDYQERNARTYNIEFCNITETVNSSTCGVYDNLFQS